MKKIIFTLALLIPSLVTAAQIPVAQLTGSTTSKYADRAATNTQLSNIQANFVELYGGAAAGFPTCTNDEDAVVWDTTSSEWVCQTFPELTFSTGLLNTDGTITGKGTVAVTASKATTYTIGTDSASESYGGTISVTSAVTITAPAVATGMNFAIVTIGDIAVSLDVNASDKMVLDGVTLADGDKATNSSKSGDTIVCQYYSADGFYCWSSTVLGGHWTDGN